MYTTGNNLTDIPAQSTTPDQKNATPVQKCIAIFNIKVCYNYVLLFIPISSKLEFFAMQNFESKFFPGTHYYHFDLNHVLHIRYICYVPFSLNF